MQRCLAVCAISACVPAAFGQLTYVQQTRSVQVATSVDGGVDTAAAPGFAPFDANLLRDVPFLINGVSGNNISVAAISCTLDFEGVKIRTRLSGQGNNNPNLAVLVSAESTILVDVVFSLTQPTPCRISGLRRIDGLATGEAYSLSVTDNLTGQVLMATTTPDTRSNLMLPAGELRMVYSHVLTNTNPELADRDLRVNMALDVCVGDYNKDGGNDGDDVIDFFADWDVSAENADVNADGNVDGDDVVFFFARWDSGC